MKQLMTYVYAVALVLTSVLVFTQIDRVSAEISEEEWTDTSVCTPVSECGSADGTKNQKRQVYKTICKDGCPTVEWTHTFCPKGFEEHKDTCRKKDKDKWIYAEFISGNTFNVAYVKSKDPNKCHKPSPSQLTDDYKMSKDEKDAFNKDNPQHLDSITSCSTELINTETRTVACQIPVSEVVACISDEETDEETEEETDVETGGETNEDTQASPTPSPTIGKMTKLGADVKVCQSSFVVTMDLTDNGNPVEGVEVTFKYNPELKVKTNKDGRARVSFDWSSSNVVTASADGFPTQQVYVERPACDEAVEAGIGGQVLGATTERGRGQVLGATTLAKTGSQTMYMAGMLMLAGAGISAISARKLL